jgi:alkanesulfonate monooxygenase SsuD/methylene tetrahydromethanopterin reductase-like flavin-dependent oxidoreductase (luciferase family)
VSLELPIYGTPIDRVLEMARIAEDAGFAGIWVPDHLVPLRPGGPQPAECWTLLSVLGATTRRVRIGPLVLVFGLRDVELLARASLTLDSLSGGRLILGLGLGGFTYGRAAKALGHAPKTLAERTTDLASGAGLLRERWQSAGGRKIPLWLGGRSAPLLDVAAAVADGWNCPFVAELDVKQDELDAACVRAGRPPGEIERSTYCVTAVAATRERAEQTLNDAGAMATLFGDVRRHHLFGTADDAVRRLAELAGAGCAEVALHLVGGHAAKLAAIDLFATRVLPAVVKMKDEQ